MIVYLKENIQLYIILAFWLVAGIFGGPVSYAVIPATMILMKKKGMYEELLIGFLFILILSDSLEDRLIFAKNAKNIYISLLSLLVLFDRKDFDPFNKLYKIFLPFFIFSVITMLFSVTDSFFFTSVQKTLSYVLTFLVIPNIVSRLYRENGIVFFRRLVYFMIITLI